MPAFGNGLASGVLGVGWALHEYARLGLGTEFDSERGRVDEIAGQTIAANAGLFNGLCGVVQYLLFAAETEPCLRARALELRPQLQWSTSGTGDGLMFLGDESLKYSLDLGTGVCGLFLTHRALDRAVADIPLLTRSGSGVASS